MKPDIKKFAARGIEEEIRTHREAITKLVALRSSLKSRRSHSRRHGRHLTAKQRREISRRMKSMWAKKRQEQ